MRKLLALLAVAAGAGVMVWVAFSTPAVRSTVPEDGTGAPGELLRAVAQCRLADARMQKSYRALLWAKTRALSSDEPLATRTANAPEDEHYIVLAALRGRPLELPIPADWDSREQVEQFEARCIKVSGVLQIGINTAALLQPGPAWSAEWDAHVQAALLLFNALDAAKRACRAHLETLRIRQPAPEDEAR